MERESIISVGTDANNNKGNTWSQSVQELWSQAYEFETDPVKGNFANGKNFLQQIDAARALSPGDHDLTLLRESAGLAELQHYKESKSAFVHEAFRSDALKEISALSVLRPDLIPYFKNDVDRWTDEERAVKSLDRQS